MGKTIYSLFVPLEMEVSMLTVRNRTIIIIIILAALLGASYAGASPEKAPSVGQPMVAVQVYPVMVTSTPMNFSTSFKKIGDIIKFEVLSSNSVVELNFNGRIYVSTFDPGSVGAYFELRVDDEPTALNYARDIVTVGEVATDIHTSITGIFTNLNPAVLHIASMWVEGLSAGGTFPMVNRNLYDSDHLVIKEYLPFGFNYLPLIRH
jgi:hypothetical protein